MFEAIQFLFDKVRLFSHCGGSMEPQFCIAESDCLINKGRAIVSITALYIVKRKGENTSSQIVHIFNSKYHIL